MIRISPPLLMVLMCGKPYQVAMLLHALKSCSTLITNFPMVPDWGIFKEWPFEWEA